MNRTSGSSSLDEVAARLAATDLDTLDKMSEDVFIPLQKLLSSLTPALERIRQSRDELSPGRDADIEALLRSVAADADVSLLTDGYRKFRWRDLLLFLERFTKLLKELDEPLSQMADGGED